MPLLLCYITDRSQFPGSRKEKEERLLRKIAECAAAGVDYIQLREKDLTVRELEALARRAVASLPEGAPTSLLISSRADVALACGARGVHLPSHDISASDARATLGRAGLTPAMIGVSCHSVQEVADADEQGADLAVFGPIFEKDGHKKSDGVALLKAACHRPGARRMPVLALGGVTLANARQCISAGAGGIAAIRLFQNGNSQDIVKKLRTMF
ncbi:MAG TPA: thiamine phosphate synthase [Verrucomicrobiae bacterium]|jgi:thiamine-phosphate pyrophosphorylase|nr:thiamine phosphate synthase [Verrucomicrobiae bacterium]